MARMTGFVFQDEYLERLAKLSDQEVGRLVRALATYHATGETQELAGRESIAFDFIKVDIDRIDQKYEARCETNRNNRQPSSTNDNDGQRNTTNDPQVKDKVKDKDKEKDNEDIARKRARATFCPPSVSEVDAYCKAQGYSVDADRFVAYYTANGWKVGRNPMKDWKAACRTWVRNGYDAPRKIAQTDYDQREYEDRKPGELPAFIREMMEEEATG